MTRHFTIEELIASDYAARHGIDNTPNDQVLENLQMLAEGLERVRSVLSVPIYVSSGYRCAKLNSAIGGARDSQHMQGLAADFTAPEFGTPYEIAEAIENAKQIIGYDQLILEFRRWVHISFADEPRMQVLTINQPGQYQYGLIG